MITPAQHDDISIHTLVGTGAFIKGDLRLDGFIRLDGDIDGNIETSGNIIIGDRARVRGNIKAYSAVIHGIVEGNIDAPESVRLSSSAAVKGDIITKKISVEERAVIQGHCIALESEDDFASSRSEWLDKKAILHKTLSKRRDGAEWNY